MEPSISVSAYWPITMRKRRALMARLKLKGIRRAILRESAGRLDLEVPNRFQFEAGYVALQMLGDIQGFKIKVKKLPFWKFWIRTIVWR